MNTARKALVQYLTFFFQKLCFCQDFAIETLFQSADGTFFYLLKP